MAANGSSSKAAPPSPLDLLARGSVDGSMAAALGEAAPASPLDLLARGSLDGSVDGSMAAALGEAAVTSAGREKERRRTDIEDVEEVEISGERRSDHLIDVFVGAGADGSLAVALGTAARDAAAALEVSPAPSPPGVDSAAEASPAPQASSTRLGGEDSTQASSAPLRRDEPPQAPSTLAGGEGEEVSRTKVPLAPQPVPSAQEILAQAQAELAQVQAEMSQPSPIFVGGDGTTQATPAPPLVPEPPQTSSSVDLPPASSAPHAVSESPLTSVEPPTSAQPPSAQTTPAQAPPPEGVGAGATDGEGVTQASPALQPSADVESPQLSSTRAASLPLQVEEPPPQASTTLASGKASKEVPAAADPLPAPLRDADESAGDEGAAHFAWPVRPKAQPDAEAPRSLAESVGGEDERTPSSDFAWPSGFGVVRSEGFAHSAFCQEHDCDLRPIRRYSADEPAACLGGLRPPITSGSAPFRWFGAHSAASSAQAKSWLGQLLQNEVKARRLQHVELILLPGQSASAVSGIQRPPLQQRAPSLRGKRLVVGARPVEPVCPPAPPASQRPCGGLFRLCDRPAMHWVWHVWAIPDGMDRAFDRQWLVSRGYLPVEVSLTITTVKGIHISLSCEDQDSRSRVYRVLWQYCEDDSCRSFPVPQAPHDFKREASSKKAGLEFARKVYRTKKENSTSEGVRIIETYTNVKDRLLWALERAENAVEAIEPVSRLLPRLVDVAEALEKAERSRTRLPMAWMARMASVLDTLVRRAVSGGGAPDMDSQDREAAQALRLVDFMQDLSLRAPLGLNDLKQYCKEASLRLPELAGHEAPLT